MARISLQKGEGSDAFHRTVHCSVGGSVYRIETFGKNPLAVGVGFVSFVDFPCSCGGGSSSCFYFGERCLKFKRRE